MLQVAVKFLFYKGLPPITTYSGVKVDFICPVLKTEWQIHRFIIGECPPNWSVRKLLMCCSVIRMVNQPVFFNRQMKRALVWCPHQVSKADPNLVTVVIMFSKRKKWTKKDSNNIVLLQILHVRGVPEM